MSENNAQTPGPYDPIIRQFLVAEESMRIAQEIEESNAILVLALHAALDN